MRIICFEREIETELGICEVSKSVTLLSSNPSDNDNDINDYEVGSVNGHGDCYKLYLQCWIWKVN